MTATDCPGEPPAIATEILRLDARGSYTEDDHHRLQEIAPKLARAWLARQVEYHPGLPSAAAIDAQRERGGWWQWQTPGQRPRLIELRTHRTPFLTDGAAPEILGNYQTGTGWFRLEGTGWRTEQNPSRKASLRAEDPSEWSWRPCTADADPLPWPGPATPPIDENPRPLEADAPWPPPANDEAAHAAWGRATLLMPWRFTIEYGPGTVIEPRTQPDGSICAGPWPVGAETVTRTVWVRVHKHCGIFAYLTENRADLHPGYISSGDTPREAVVLAAQKAAGFCDVVKMRRFRSLRVEPVGPAEPEVCPRCGHTDPKPHAEAHLRMCGAECPCAGGAGEAKCPAP